MSTEKLSELSKPVAWLAIYHGDVYDEAISITRSVVEAQAERFGWESALTEITPLYSQEYVSALLQRITELERTNQSQDDHINQQQDRIDSLEKKNGDLGRSLGAAEKRLAKPVRLLGEMLPHEWERAERQAAFEHRKIAWDARLAEDKKAILAAGFTFTVEGGK
ncbi:hypothetical protein OHN11_09740 [Serratia marcescens]|uniref:hypothetical protein n=1 Tax=Serratia marcescens TaxID=615 RepID=UPI0004231B54|nr:hypothetical protein [Serratia marcescens]EIJ7464295.1 hypothetical protein [Serratia marcescens]EJA2551632.1 hypothetical protein [Serratia marcescens]EJA2596540.1 hypothetical protein [Serratia marcescens]EME9756256.1 hypothetical protein [Serratia marcescens]MDM3533592.1 hypothetical protein [Serratia marcescens]